MGRKWRSGLWSSICNDAYTTDKVNIITEAPEGSHKEVSYPIAAIKDTKNLDASKAFIDFLSTEESKEVFKNMVLTLNKGDYHELFSAYNIIEGCNHLHNYKLFLGIYCAYFISRSKRFKGG